MLLKSHLSSTTAMSYTHLASIYDQLMSDTPYDKWLHWAQNYWKKHGQPRTIIDLGCGTGSIAIPLAKQGYQVTGIDLSSEMLAIAYEKMHAEQAHVTWLEQDMRAFTAQPADSVISFCDSMSYLLEEEDVQETIKRAYQHLQPGGAFLFDVHSPYKIMEVFGNHTFTYVEDEVSYIWQCFTDAERQEVAHELTFFVRQANGLYERLEEEHAQRAYQPHLIVSWLTQAGFRDIVVTADFEHAPPHGESERLFFSAKKPNEQMDK